MPKLLFSFCLFKRVFINRYFGTFSSLEILSSLFRLFQSLIDLTENDRPPSVKLFYMGQRKFISEVDIKIHLKHRFQVFRCFSNSHIQRTLLFSHSQIVRRIPAKTKNS